MSATVQTTARAHIPDQSQLPLSFRMLRASIKLTERLSPRLAGRIGANLFSTPVGKAKVRMRDAIMQQARLFELPFEGGHVALYEWGAADAPTVLLVHGWRSKAEQMRHLVAPLLAAGYRAAALDLPAHGRSSGRQTNPLRVSKALETIGAHYGPLHAIIAHSFGTYGTAFLVHNNPRFAVEKLVLISGPDHVSDVTGNFVKLLGLSDRVRQLIDRDLERQSGQTLDVMSSANIFAGYAKPGLVVHDRDDLEVDFECAKRIVAGWDSAELFSTNGLGHHNVLRNEAVIARIADFLGN